MATDSSSGPLPSSSRLTIDSSSSSARSKLSFLTSAWAISAILIFLDARQRLERRGSLKCRTHQGTDMGCDRFFQSLEIITALDSRDNSAARGAIGEIHQLARYPSKVFGLQIKRSQWVTI